MSPSQQKKRKQRFGGGLGQGHLAYMQAKYDLLHQTRLASYWDCRQIKERLPLANHHGAGWEMISPMGYLSKYKFDKDSLELLNT